MSRVEALENRIDLLHVPFTERGSRLLLGRQGDRLHIRLVERWEKYGGSLRAFRQRPPIIRNMALLSREGTPILLETESYPYVVRLKTAAGVFSCVFPETEAILIRLPGGTFGFEFDVEVREGQIDRRGGTMHGTRNVAYTTNARLLENHMALAVDTGLQHVRIMLEAQDGNALLINVTPRLGFNRAIPSPEGAISTAEARWSSWLSAPPPVPAQYETQYAYAWWIMGQGLLSQRYYSTREALVPSKLHYIGAWLWDQSFHAIAYRHVDAKLAEDQLRIMLDHQLANGMLPDAVHDEGIVTYIITPIEGTVTKPPIIAWSALKLYESSGNRDFLSEIYEPLTRWHEWWLRDNLNACGLCEYRHPFSSGLDNSPLFDFGMPVVGPDLNTYLYTQMESLAQIATLIGLDADARMYRERAAAWLEKMIAVLWNEAQGVFDFLHDGQRIPVMTPFSLLPLWTGALPDTMNARLIDHLTNPEEFWSPHPIPTVALNDPKFDPNDMWRGPSWPNINYLFVEALNRIGRVEIADELRRRTLNTLMQHRDIYEYYQPITADRPPKAAPIFGWSAAVYIDLAIQEAGRSG